MDIPAKQNKMMGADDAENKGPKIQSILAESSLTQRYFFPPQNGYQAISIVAAYREQAEEGYFAKRIPVEPEAKVDEGTKDNNQ